MAKDIRYTLWEEIDRYHKESGKPWHMISIDIGVHPYTRYNWESMKYGGGLSVVLVMAWIARGRTGIPEGGEDE